MVDRTRIGLNAVRAMPPGSELWDSAVLGFGARRQRSDAVAYVVVYRTADGRQRRYTIGRHGAPWTPDKARVEAKRILGAVAAGADPAAAKTDRRKAVTVADLCDDYWADATEGRLLVRGGKPKKPSTLASDKGRIDRHIKPQLGKLAVRAVTRADIERFMHAVGAGDTKRAKTKTKPRGLSIVRGGKGVATRTVGLLGALFSYAIKNGLRSDNPAHRIQKFAENRRDRRLSDAEYAILGAALAKADAAGIWPHAAAAARFLVLTGWRSGEALSLRGADVDFDRRYATLADTKTGRSMRPLSHAALAVVKGQGDTDPVFPPSKGKAKATMTGFGRFWDKIAALGPLPADISPHVLRHSFASVAADLGYSELIIGALIGHKSSGITARYIHSTYAILLAAADAVATRTLELMSEAKPPGAVVQLRGAA